MVNQDVANSNGHGSFPAASSFSSRDLIAIGFRHKRAVVLCFCGILLGAILAAVFLPSEYVASAKFLIERERVDPIVSPVQDAQVVVPAQITEEDLNSEVELLESEDVLRQVVVASGLQHRKSLADFLPFLNRDEERLIAKAVERLRTKLQVEPLRKSNVIAVNYTATDPQLALRVLMALDDAYIQKNVAVHRPPGQFEFFDKETERYKQDLADTETQLKTFSEQDGGVAPQLARDITLQKLNEFSATLQQTRADASATEQRIRALESQSGATPQRLTTQARHIDDAQVLQGLKNTLMSLELKRTELLTKYQPTYPLVQEVEKQIKDTHDSIVVEENKPLREETTDRNPTYAWIDEELAKSKADYITLQARASATQAIVTEYQAKAHELEQKGILQQDLLRKMKADEENYLLYQHKREEARMTDALDRTRILNVALAEQPTLPTLPSNSPWLVLLLGMLLAVTVSAGTAFALEYLDPSFRTPSEVLSELEIPVLAAVPHAGSGFGASTQRKEVEASSRN